MSNVLDWVDMLSGLYEKERDQLAMFCQEKFLEAGEVLFNENDEASAMYFLKKWGMEISKNIDWQKSVIWEVHSEEILWEMALFWDTDKRMATATALTDSTLIVILSFSIKDLAYNHPDLLWKIKMIINERNMKNKLG